MIHLVVDRIGSSSVQRCVFAITWLLKGSLTLKNFIYLLIDLFGVLLSVQTFRDCYKCWEQKEDRIILCLEELILSIIKSRIYFILFLICSILYLFQRFPWRRKWQPTPVLLPGKSLEEPGRLQSMGSQRVGCYRATSFHLEIKTYLELRPGFESRLCLWLGQVIQLL